MLFHMFNWDSYHVLAKCVLLENIETNVNDVENNPGPAVFNNTNPSLVLRPVRAIRGRWRPGTERDSTKRKKSPRSARKSPINFSTKSCFSSVRIREYFGCLSQVHPFRTLEDDFRRLNKIWSPIC